MNRIVAQGGRVTGVDTNQGFIAGDSIVVAAGLWSRSLLRSVDVALAQWPCGEHFYVIAEVSPALARTTPSFVMRTG